MYTFISRCENDTINFAKQIATKLNNGDTILLCGELGSGKTKFTQGILEHFGLDNEISSPTFTIVNEHHKNAINIYHFDVYRLSDSSEFYAIGGEEYLNNGICIIEWGDIIEDILPNEYIKISFEKDDNDINLRKLNLQAFGNRFTNIIEGMKNL